MKTPLLAVILGLFVASFGRADDWPQFRGPNRSGVSKETGLLKTWPKGGPTLAWTFKDAGLGFSSVAVVKGVVYTLGTDMKCNDEYVIAINEKDGIEKWRTKIGPVFTFAMNVWGDGPRSTPTIDGNLLYALSGNGEVVCVDITMKGKVVWRKHLVTDFLGVMMSKWGYSESPLVDGDLLICTPGGAGGTLLALDKKTGIPKWQTKAWNDSAPYSSPIVAEIQGVRQYIQAGYVSDIKGAVLAGVNAKNGKVLWSKSITSGASYSVSPTPIARGNQVYVSTDDGFSHLFDINANWEVTDTYAPKSQKTMKNAFGGVVLLGNNLYGHTKPGRWLSQDLATGMAGNWSAGNKLNCNSGALVAADGMIFLYTDDGEVGLADVMNPEASALKASFALPVRSKLQMNRPSSQDSKTWNLPAIANGHLYLRDHEYIFAYKISGK